MGLTPPLRRTCAQVALRPEWAKGYSRKGAALYGLGRFAEAVATYRQGLKSEPDNAQMKQACADIEDKLQLAKTLFEAVSDGARPSGHTYCEPVFLRHVHTPLPLLAPRAHAHCRCCAQDPCRAPTRRCKWGRAPRDMRPTTARPR